MLRYVLDPWAILFVAFAVRLRLQDPWGKWKPKRRVVKVVKVVTKEVEKVITKEVAAASDN